MSKIIEIIVSPKGETQIETKGFVGGECREASKFLEEALGKREQERMTSEFYVSQSVHEQSQQRNQDALSLTACEKVGTIKIIISSRKTINVFFTTLTFPPKQALLFVLFKPFELFLIFKAQK